MSENDTRTPPKIVAASERPAVALAAFIAQELEAWGFGVRAVGERTLSVDGLLVMTQ